MSFPDMVTLDFPQENIDSALEEIQCSKNELVSIERQLRILKLYYYLSAHHQDKILKIVLGPDEEDGTSNSLYMCEYRLSEGLACFIRLSHETQMLKKLLNIPAFSHMKEPSFENNEIIFTNNAQHRFELFSFFLDDYSVWLCYNQRYSLTKKLEKDLPANQNQNQNKDENELTSKI